MIFFWIFVALIALIVFVYATFNELANTPVKLENDFHYINNYRLVCIQGIYHIQQKRLTEAWLEEWSTLEKFDDETRASLRFKFYKELQRKTFSVIETI